MTAIALFSSTFALVFLLGVQQLNVQHGHQTAAFFTSLFIGISQLALYKMAPDAGGIEIAGYLAGGPLAIICAMRVHPWLRRIWDRRGRTAAAAMTHNVEFSERSAAGAESAGTQGSADGSTEKGS